MSAQTSDDLEAGLSDNISKIMEDAEEVFGWRSDVRPQERAHAYLEAHKVSRGVSDTALLRVAQDLIGRTREVCKMDGTQALALLGEAIVDAQRRLAGDVTQG